MEYEIEAEILHSFISQRASGEAYGSIIASGDRARTCIMYRTTRNVKTANWC
jgi:Xaa-Pro aminopeptidase